jgi:hypothetical protein
MWADQNIFDPPIFLFYSLELVISSLPFRLLWQVLE